MRGPGGPLEALGGGGGLPVRVELAAHRMRPWRLPGGPKRRQQSPGPDEAEDAPCAVLAAPGGPERWPPGSVNTFTGKRGVRFARREEIEQINGKKRMVDLSGL